MKLKYYIILLCLAICLSSCKSMKNKKIKGDEEKTEETKIEETNKESTTYIGEIKSDLNYEWLSFRSKLEIKSESNSQSVNLFIVNKKDSILYVNISKFAIEAARAVISPDTVKFINRLQMEYYVGDYSIFEKMFGVRLNFNMLQSIINACDFKDFKTEAKYVNYENYVEANWENRENSIEKILLNQNIKYRIKEQQIFENNIIDIRSGRKINISYLDYSKYKDFELPSKIQINLAEMDMEMTFKLDKIKIDVPGPTSIKIPDRYKAIDAQ